VSQSPNIPTPLIELVPITIFSIGVRWFGGTTQCSSGKARALPGTSYDLITKP
jgi:hypothetical protein